MIPPIISIRPQEFLVIASEGPTEDIGRLDITSIIVAVKRPIALEYNELAAILSRRSTMIVMTGSAVSRRKTQDLSESVHCAGPRVHLVIA